MQRILQLLEELKEDLDGIEKVEEAHGIINEYLSKAEKVYFELLEEDDNNSWESCNISGY